MLFKTILHLQGFLQVLPQQVLLQRELLLSRIWGYDFEGNERVLDNHIKKLRKALGPAGGQIRTVIAQGYKISEERR